MFANVAEVESDVYMTEDDISEFNVAWDTTVTVDMSVVHEISVENGYADEKDISLLADKIEEE